MHHRRASCTYAAKKNECANQEPQNLSKKNSNEGTSCNFLSDEFEEENKNVILLENFKNELAVFFLVSSQCDGFLLKFTENYFSCVK